MAHNEDNRKSEGVCEKIFNAIFSPFRAKSRRVSNQNNQPRYSISTTDVPIMNAPNSNSAAKTSPFQTKPAHIVHQQTIPFDFEPPVAYHRVQKVEKEVVNDDDDSMKSEAMFSEYISKVKQQMMKTESNGNGDGGGGDDGRSIAPREDSFNDNVANYIRRSKMKIRTTTTIGNHKSFSFK